MKYIIQRADNSYGIINAKKFRPANAIIEYTGQVPESDLPYTTITDGPLDEFGQSTKVFTVDTVAKAAAEAAQTASVDAQNWADLRKQRDDKLKACDHTQLEDSIVSVQKKADYVVYRAALRDIPANTVDPTNPTWPVEPV
jgi:hypothetical protein